LVAAGVNLAIDLLFVRKIGITAGSVSTLVAYFLLYVYRAINVQKFQKVKVNIGKQVLQVAVMIVMLVICALRITSLDILNFILGVVLCIIANWTIVKFVISKVIRRKGQ
jgi:4-amino-4-deoxy-L-arabinose transferase-like glycosyltransferase